MVMTPPLFLLLFHRLTRLRPAHTQYGYTTDEG